MNFFVKNRKTVGNTFNAGDIAYYKDGLIQYQVQLAGTIKQTAIAIPKMVRHRETINGVETGVWCKWSLPPRSMRRLTVRVEHLTKTDEPVTKKKA